jgi:hypothetical protein
MNGMLNPIPPLPDATLGVYPISKLRATNRLDFLCETVPNNFRIRFIGDLRDDSGRAVLQLPVDGENRCDVCGGLKGVTVRSFQVIRT